MNNHSPETDPNAKQQRAEVLSSTLVGLRARISSNEAQFLKLLAEFDRDELWRCFGSYSAAQWLSWQCGLGEVAARERVRVAHALEKLPSISASFASGEISYSKVREITRVATAENEQELLTIARHSTAAQIEQLVRKYRRVGRAEAAEQYRRRSVRYSYDDEGMLVIEARLPPEIGQVVLKALDAAAEELYQDALSGKRSEEAAIPVETESNVPAGTEQQIAVENAESETSPAPLGTRRADALRLLAESFLASGADHVDTSADRYQVVVHIDQALLASAGALLEAPTGGGPLFPRCELAEGPALAIATARKLACDGALVGIVEDQHSEPLSVGRKTRAIPPAMRRALRARDGGCRFPGCSRTRFTHGHHIVHWFDGGETKLSNLVTLCTHHHGLIHDEGFTVERADDGAYMFFRPDGERLPDTANADHTSTSTSTTSADHTLRTSRKTNDALRLLDPGGYRC